MEKDRKFEKNQFSNINREEDVKFDRITDSRNRSIVDRGERSEEKRRFAGNGKFGGEESIFNRNHGENREDGKKSGEDLDFRSWKMLGASENTAERHGDDARGDERGENEVRVAFGADPSNFTSREASNMRPTCFEAPPFLLVSFFPSLFLSLFFFLYYWNFIGISFTPEMEEDTIRFIDKPIENHDHLVQLLIK